MFHSIAWIAPLLTINDLNIIILASVVFDLIFYVLHFEGFQCLIESWSHNGLYQLYFLHFFPYFLCQLLIKRKSSPFSKILPAIWTPLLLLKPLNQTICMKYMPAVSHPDGIISFDFAQTYRTLVFRLILFSFIHIGHWLQIRDNVPSNNHRKEKFHLIWW